MNHIEEILTAAVARDIHFKVEGEKVIAIPANAVTPDLLVGLRKIKPDLLKVYAQCVIACHGLSVSPETVFASLTPFDISVIVSGEIGADGMRAYSESLDTGIRSRRVLLNERGQVTTHFNFAN